jgi:hypothetical protein
MGFQEDKDWVKGGKLADSILKPVKDFTSGNQKKDTTAVPDANGWIKGGNYNTNEFLDIRQTIGDVNKIKDQYEKVNLTTEDSKKNRLTEIDQELNKAKAEQKRIASQKFEYPTGIDPTDSGVMMSSNEISKSKDVDKYTEKIKELTNEKNRLSVELKPVTSAEKKEVLETSGMDFLPGEKIKEFELIQKIWSAIQQN